MRNDLFFLRHMIDEVRFIKTHFKGRPKELLMEDEVMRKAVQKSLENISVAAHNLSPELKMRWYTVDWERLSRLQVDMKTMFLSVDKEYVIKIIQFEMPRLEQTLNMIMANDYPGQMVREWGGLQLPQI